MSITEKLSNEQIDTLMENLSNLYENLAFELLNLVIEKDTNGGFKVQTADDISVYDLVFKKVQITYRCIDMVESELMIGTIEDMILMENEFVKAEIKELTEPKSAALVRILTELRTMPMFISRDIVDIIIRTSFAAGYAQLADDFTEMNQAVLMDIKNESEVMVTIMLNKVRQMLDDLVKEPGSESRLSDIEGGIDD